MICRNCNSQIPSNTSTCFVCGFQNQLNSTPQNSDIICSRCGAEIDNTSIKCKYCGSKVEHLSANEANERIDKSFISNEIRKVNKANREIEKVRKLMVTSLLFYVISFMIIWLIILAFVFTVISLHKVIVILKKHNVNYAEVKRFQFSYIFTTLLFIIFLTISNVEGLDSYSVPLTLILVTFTIVHLWGARVWSKTYVKLHELQQKLLQKLNNSI